jgi:hypothetical protein
MATPWYDWFNPVYDFTTLFGSAGQVVGDWLSSTAGYIASGLEAGMVALLGDVFDVVVGPLEVIVGLLIIIVTLSWMSRNGIGQIGQLAFQVAALAGMV